MCKITVSFSCFRDSAGADGVSAGACNCLKLPKFPVPQGSQQELSRRRRGRAELSAGVVASSAYTCPAKKAELTGLSIRQATRTFVHLKPFLSFFSLYYTLFLKFLKL